MPLVCRWAEEKGGGEWALCGGSKTALRALQYFTFFFHSVFIFSFHNLSQYIYNAIAAINSNEISNVM